MPAGEGELKQLFDHTRFELPAAYIALLRHCNGGYGPLDAPPLFFRMDSIAESIANNEVWHAKGLYRGFWFIGGNGGLETIGFDIRGGQPWPLVMIDCIAGDDSAERIATDISDFINRIGLERGGVAS